MSSAHESDTVMVDNTPPVMILVRKTFCISIYQYDNSLC